MGALQRFTFPFALVLGFEPAGAANLLTNPDFATSLAMSGWTWGSLDSGATEGAQVCTVEPTCGAMRFSDDDCCAVENSGSATSESSFFYTYGLSQCVADIAPDTAYDVGAYLRVTTDAGLQPGLPYIGLAWYPTSDCSGGPVTEGGQITGSDSRSWSRTPIVHTIAPSAARSAKLFLLAGPTGDSGSNVTMQFDSAFFGPSGTVPVELQSFEVD